MARCAARKSVKMVGCSRFSVRCFGNLKVEHQTDFRVKGMKMNQRRSAGGSPVSSVESLQESTAGPAALQRFS